MSLSHCKKTAESPLWRLLLVCLILTTSAAAQAAEVAVTTVAESVAGNDAAPAAGDQDAEETAEVAAAEIADVKAPRTLAVDLYFDNDAFSSGRDRDYTGGIALAFSGVGADDHPASVDVALGWIDQFLGVDRQRNQDIAGRGYEVGFLAFTPDDIESTAPQIHDRPYASLVYVSNKRQTIDFASRTSVITALSVGALGLSAVGQLQNSAHRLTGSRLANGWQHQISEGGEPTFKYSASWQKHRELQQPKLQATALAGFSVGYLSEAQVGLSIRYGRLRTPWWSFNVHSSNYGERTSISVPTARPLREIYLLAGTAANLRLYNAFLQGQFRHSEVRYSPHEIAPLVFEGWFGVGGELESGLRLAFVLRRQSSSLRTGLADRPFTFGELVGSVKF